MSECSEATIESRTRPRRLPCEGFRPNEPKRVLAGYVRRLGSVTRLSVEKSPVFFLLFTGRPFLLLAAVACTRPVSKSRSIKKRPVLAKRTRRSPKSNPMQTWPERTQAELAEGQRAGRTSLSRDSARMVISAIVEGLRHNDFRHFPQTKPISANEANAEKVNETMLQDEQHAPLRSGARTRLLCACSGAAGSAFCQPVQIDDEGSL